MKPTIAICIPSGRTWEAEMALSLVSVVRETALDIAVLNLTGSQITTQRNELVRRALLEYDASHLFWWDSDMIFPPTVIYELLEHKKEIVGATYCKRVPPYAMLGKMERADGRLKPATRMPGGCMLVTADVYRRLKWPWYFETLLPEQEVLQSEDYSFCATVIGAGIPIWCDINLSQRIQHIGQQNITMQLKEGHPDRVEKQHG